MEYEYDDRKLTYMFFLTKDKEDNQPLQGQIIKFYPDSTLLCDHFSWIDGSWTFSKLYKISDVLDWILFKNQKQLTEYQNNYKRRRLQTCSEEKQ